jgi:hypothetical protein
VLPPNKSAWKLVRSVASADEERATGPVAGVRSSHEEPSHSHVSESRLPSASVPPKTTMRPRYCSSAEACPWRMGGVVAVPTSVQLPEPQIQVSVR